MLEFTYNNKKTYVKNAFSSFRCNRVRSAKTYVNQFLALTNAIYSTIVNFVLNVCNGGKEYSDVFCGWVNLGLDANKI
jgi:hypothetical protein